MSKPLTMEQFENNTAREWASGAYQSEIRATIEERDQLRADLAHEKTMRAGAEHRATYAEKTQQEYARTVETLTADNARLHALIKAGEMGTASEDRCPWCKRSMEYGDRLHAADCPAFTQEGGVR